MNLSDNLRSAMLQQWDTIGADCLQAVTDTTGEKYPSMPKDEVIELVLDASRLEMSAEGNRDPELLQEIKDFRELSYEDQMKMAEQVFTFDSYGY